MSKVQQTLSEEVSERARSRMLQLEKENQSLLRTIEKLRTASSSSSQASKHSYQHEREHTCRVVGGTDNCNSSCHGSVMSCNTSRHQQPHVVESEGVQSANHSDLRIEEKGQLENGVRGDCVKEWTRDLEVLENSHNRLHCFGGLSDNCPDGILTGLPTRSPYASKHTQRLQAKCRALDTVNQHLQTSLDNTGMD